MSINAGSINGFSINGAPAAAPAVDFNDALDVHYDTNGHLNDALDVHYDTFNLPDLNDALDVHYKFAPSPSADLSQLAGLVVDAEVDRPIELVIDASVTGPAIFLAEADVDGPAPLTDLVLADVEAKAPLTDAIPVDADLEGVHDLVTGAALTAVAGLLPLVQADVDGSAPLLVTVQADVEGEHDLADPPVAGDVKGVHALLEEASISVTGAITLTRVETGRRFEVLKGTIDFDQGGHFWAAAIELGFPSDGELFSFDDEVELDVFGETFSMVVDSRQLSRDAPDVGELEQSAALRLLSKSARTDVPRADPFTGALETAQLASSAAAAVLGEPVAWNTVDWLVPANVVAGDGASPIQVAQQIAGAAGALVETLPDGSIVVRDLFPVRVADYDTATPKHVYTEDSDVMRATEEIAFDDVINRLRIRNAGDAEIRDAMEFEADEDDGRRGTLRIFPTPFRVLTLETTSDSDVGVLSLGQADVEIEQLVEFREGQATLSRPIFAIDSVEWMDDDLGPVTFDQDDTRLFAQGGDFSLATVTYRARALEFRVSSTKDDVAQFLSVDSPGATGGVDIIAVRGLGDIDGGEVVDPLISSQLVALRRARNEMDDRAEPKVPVTLTTVFRPDVLSGDLVQVDDGFRNVTFRAKVISIQHVIDSGAAITTLVVEKVEAF